MRAQVDRNYTEIYIFSQTHNIGYNTHKHKLAHSRSCTHNVALATFIFFLNYKDYILTYLFSFLSLQFIVHRIYLISLDCLRSVSYTHLDVYKRQR